MGAIYTRTNFVTLKYVTDAWGTNANGFRLVITAVKDPSEYIYIYTSMPKRFSANRPADVQEACGSRVYARFASRSRK